MKVVSNQSAPALTSGVDSVVNMGISTDPEDQLMILNVLSNSLYTDKISAVLREYGCNAFDANVEAGRGNQPIEVRLPNRLESALCIRDFGFGMTEEQILTVFCRLGRSTKRASNAFTGMLGIGSKAGFAYGDSFMVTSYTHGVKCIYNAYRERGAPRLAKLDEQPTDAPDGVEVKVPVRVSDIEEFHEKAERVFRYFKVRPIICGAKIEFSNDEKRFEGTGWRYTGSGRSYAIMGNVGYDLSADSMGTMSEHLKTLIRLGVELDFEIGDLEIAANREGLQYKDITKKSISERLAVLSKEVGTIFTQQIAGAKTLWEAKKMYGEIFEQRGDYSISELRRIVGNTITWQGQKIDTGRFYIGNKEKDPKVISVTVAGKRNWTTRIQTELSAEWCYANDKTRFVVNDLPTKKNSPTRVKGFFEANTDALALVILAFDDDKAQARYWKHRELDGVTPVLMSTIPPSVNTNSTTGGPSAHKAKHSAKAFVIDEKSLHHDRATKSVFWNKEDVDAGNGTGVYVKIDKFYVVAPKCAGYSSYNFESSPYHFIRKIKELRNAGLLDPSEKIYGFKESWLAEKPGRLGKGWVSLQDHLKSVVDKLCAGNKMEQEMTDYFAAASYDAFMDEAVLKSVPKGTSLHTLLTELTRMRNPKTPKKTLDLLHDNEGRPWVDRPTLPDASIDLRELEKQVRKDYPLLSAWADDRPGKLTNLASTEIKLVVEYMTLLDSKP